MGWFFIRVGKFEKFEVNVSFWFNYFKDRVMYRFFLCYKCLVVDKKEIWVNVEL